MTKNHKEVAIVKELLRFPVKSMAGERVEEVKLGWHGFAGDRRYAFVKRGDKTGLPWLSARDYPQLILYRPHFLSPERIDSSEIEVCTPAGSYFDLKSEELRMEIELIYGNKIELMQLWRGTYDSMALSLISLQAIDTISQQIGSELEIERFRPNIVVESLDGKPFPEDRWVGELLNFGDRSDSASVRADRKDLRCSIVNLDPGTAKSNSNILDLIVRSRKNLLGLYGSTQRPGTIKVGDIISMLKS